MIKEDLEKLIEKGYSVREIKKITLNGYSTIRYWLNKFGLKTKNSNLDKKKNNFKKICKVCNEEKDIIFFYKSRNKVGTYCKNCSNLYHSNRVRDIKIKMIDYKGGECKKCNLQLEKSHYSVFDFHHLDPNEKDSNFKQIKSWKWDRIKEEIDKCELLCANCHRIEHAVLCNWGKVERIVGFKKEREINKCRCGKEIHLASNSCLECHENILLSKKNKKTEKVTEKKARKRKVENRPSIESLKNDVNNIGFRATGRKYGVSDNCIRKWIKNYGN